MSNCPKKRNINEGKDTDAFGKKASGLKKYTGIVTGATELPARRTAKLQRNGEVYINDVFILKRR